MWLSLKKDCNNTTSYKILVLKPEARQCLIIAALFDAEVCGAHETAAWQNTPDNTKEVAILYNEVPLLQHSIFYKSANT